ncbi:MAG: hypothetical protein ABGX60_00045 [Candidatus Thioglobus sp.]|jgi:hypothetical protein
MDKSWGALDLEGDHLTKMRADNEAKAQEIASQFFQCFNSDAGKLVLNRLKDITINRPVLYANSTQFSAGIREGQNQIVRQILEQIKIANGE